MKHAENVHKEKHDNTEMRETGVDYAPLLIIKVQTCKIANAQRELSIEDFHLCFMVVERN